LANVDDAAGADLDGADIPIGDGRHGEAQAVAKRAVDESVAFRLGPIPRPSTVIAQTVTLQ